MDPSTLCQLIAQAFWLVLGGGLSLLGITWQLFRTRRYLREALAREQQRHIAIERGLLNSNFAKLNGLQRSLLESFLREPTPSLSDLVERTEREWRAKASVPPSEATDPTIELRTGDIIPR